MALEVGCMFKEDEGLSTLVLAQSIRMHPKGGRLISIEYDQTHVHAARRILARQNPDVQHIVEFRVGHSLAHLPSAIQELGAIDFASLDGGAHPEVCLHEFELVSQHLSPDGVILVDDLQELAPSDAYSLPRPFGKGTLILPMLLIQQYLANRDRFNHANDAPDGPNTRPSSPWLQTIKQPDNGQKPRDFAVLGQQQRMLAYGADNILRSLRQAHQVQARSSVLRRALRKLRPPY